MSGTRVGMTVSTEPGRFRAENYRSEYTGRYVVSWQYCDWQGVLHSGTSSTRDAAVQQAARFGYRPYCAAGRRTGRS
jgi:hypothetical protein